MNIRHLNDVLPHIEENSHHYIIAKRDGYTFVDYEEKLDHDDSLTFSHECKGLKFDANNDIIARPFHKFLTYRASLYPIQQKLTENTSCVISEKLDGVLVHPAIIYGALVLMTRRGRTHIAVQAEKLLTQDLKKQSQILLETGLTPLFEFTSPDSRHIIKYPHAQLSLLAIRENISGTYLPEEKTTEIAKNMQVEQPLKFSHSLIDVPDFLQNAKNLKGKKGFVIRVGDNSWYQYITNYYKNKRAMKDSIYDEKRLLSLILQNHIDDVIPLLSHREKVAIKYYRKSVRRGIGKTTEKIHHIITAGTQLDHKTFTNEHIRDYPPIIRSLALSVRAGKYNSPYEAIRSHLMEHIKAEHDMENVRDIIQADWP